MGAPYIGRWDEGIADTQCARPYIGRCIKDDILQNKRAGYGKQIVATLSLQLQKKYGNTFELTNLRRMMQFAEQITDAEIVSTLPTQ
jgi:hypothetical protein